MASATFKKKLQTKHKRTKAGKRRKRRERTKGSTPKFPIHLD